MAKRQISVRIALAAVLLGLIVLSAGISPVAAQVTGAEAQVYVQQLIDETTTQAPVFGPASAELPYEAYEDCPECTWAAGLSATDLRVHIELDWHGAGNLPGGLFLAIRQLDPDALDILSPNFITIMGTTWMVGGASGEFLIPPETIDVVAMGNQGYLLVNEELVATMDLSAFTGPGDVVLTAGMMVNNPGGSLGINNFTVWELGTVATAPDGAIDSQPGDAAAQFDAYRLTALTQPLIYGPSSGSLLHDPEVFTFQDAGVSVTNFAAHVTCSAPVSGFNALWDCGLVFRDPESANHFRVAVVSDGTWYLDTGGSDGPLQWGELGVSSGFQSGAPVTMDLIVDGATGYLGVNDVFISTLDVSAMPGPGTVGVATSFFTGTYIEGGETPFQDFGVVSLDAPQPSTDIQDPPASDPLADVPGVAGNTFTDTTYGYSLIWDGSWTVVEPVPGQPEDLLRLTNGPVTADIYGSTYDTDPTSCVTKALAFYQNTAGYSDAAFVLDANNQQMISPGADIALGLLTFTYTDTQAVASEFYDYVMCAALPDGQSMLTLEQYVAPDDYASQLDAMNALQMGVQLDGGGVPPNAPDDVPDPVAEIPAAPDAQSGDAAVYQQYVAQTDALAPVAGPAAANLVPTIEVGGAWKAGISLRDVRLHLDVTSPVAPTDWDLLIGLRRHAGQSEFVNLIQDSDTLIVSSSGHWTTSTGSGTVTGPVVSVDVVADGDLGYLGINGQFVATFDASLAIGPGDVVLAASLSEGGDGSLNLANVTVWDLTGAAPEVVAQSSSPDAMTADSDTFANIWSRSITGAAVFGPVSGTMTHLPVEVSVHDAELSVADFAAQVTCTAPATAPSGVWDCGLEFRNVGGDGHFRLVVTSDGRWGLGINAEDPEQWGEGITALDETGSRMAIQLIVTGTTGYFAVNGSFIATLDLAAFPVPGSVAAGTAFYTDTYVEGGATGYADFTVWSLDPLPASVAGSEAISGNSYTSPTFGYTLTWDRNWFPYEETSQDGADYLVLTSERATAVLSATESGATTATGCFENLIDGYLGNPAYSNVRFVVSPEGLPIMNEGDHVATGLLQYSFTSDGLTTDGYNYVLCARMPDSGTMVHLEQFIPADGFVHFKPEMEELQSGMWVTGEKSIIPPGLPELHFAVLPVSDADRATYEQITAASDVQRPLAGPASVDLVMQGADYAQWSAGVTARDIRVHVELAPPAGELDADWEFQIEFRAAGYGSDGFYLASDGVFAANGFDGYLDRVPATIDLIASGDIGYLAFDGELVGLVDLSTWMQPGDVVLNAVNTTQPAGSSTLHVANVTVWNLSGQS